MRYLSLHYRFPSAAKRLVVLCITSLTIVSCGGGGGAKEPRQKVELGKPDSDVDPEVIGAAVRANPRFSHCFETARERNPSLSGLIEVRFLINPDGSIGQAMAAGTSFPPDLTECVVNAFYSLQLPKQESACIAQYPLYFQPG